jgi:hypothetical protein
MGHFFFVIRRSLLFDCFVLVGGRTKVKQRMKSRVVCVFRFVVLFPRECEREIELSLIVGLR